MFVILAAAVMASAASADPSIRLVSIEAERIESRPNLLSNGGFEQLDPRGFPIGWSWDRRNTDATCTVDKSVAHSGGRCLKMTNGTPFGPHIYGMLWRVDPVQVTMGKAYTVSAWFRSERPGIVTLMTGAGWQFRVQAPATGREWRRVALTFTPGEQDRDLVVRVGTESPTAGCWIDDVKLEEGAEATPYVDEEQQGLRADLTPIAERAEVDGDGSFRIGMIAEWPGGVPTTLRARLAGHVLERRLPLEAGFWRLSIVGESSGASSAPRDATLEMEAAGARVAARASVTFYSSASAMARLDALAKRLPALRSRIEARRKRGEDVSYPLVSMTVLENFVRYAREDIPRETRRAIQQIGDLEGIAQRLDAQLRSSARLPAVPVRIASVRTKVRDGAFLAPVRLPSGKIVQDYPVFLNGYGHFGQVVADMEKWPSYGCNLIQVEFGPNSVFPAEGQTNMEPVQRMRGILDRAQKAGVMVCLLVSPHYMPDWAFGRWPQLRKRREGFIQYCIHAPEGRELLQRFIKTAIAPLANHPALHSICLSNEPVNAEEPCAYAVSAWHRWLAQVHGDLATLNRRWGRTYAAFDDIPLPDPLQPHEPGPEWMDFVRLNQEQFAGWHRMLADAVHEVAPDLPVHAKAMTWTFNEPSTVRYGVDAYLFGSFSQINGNDSANMVSYGDEAAAQSWEGNAISYDLQKSVAPGPVFNSENHLIPDRETRWVPPQHVRTALWQEAVHGQGASAIWVWERTFDRKSDFAGSIMHRPACAEAVGIVNYDLNRAAREVTALQRAPFDAVILQSVTSLVWDGGMVADCSQKLYSLLTFSGIKTGFIEERQLEQGALPTARVILVPSIRHLSRRALAALGAVRDRLVFVGGPDVLSRDEYDAPVEPPEARSRIPYLYGKTTMATLQEALPALLRGFGVTPLVFAREVGREGHRGVDLVETRSAVLDGARIVDVVNYRRKPVTVILQDGSGPVVGVDVLTGRRIVGRLTLAPLEFRLVRVPPRPSAPRGCSRVR